MGCNHERGQLQRRDQPNYPLRDLATKRCPEDLGQLTQWLTKRGEWRGKLYVASSITWNAKCAEFFQEGCSPNYLEGYWSLACCKHDMRKAKNFCEQVENGKPTFIFTLASKSDDLGCQSLVSVARVTKCFKNMKEYAEFILKQGDALQSSRFTRFTLQSKGQGLRFGDCHADSKGEVGKPHLGHVHHKRADDESWKRDLECSGVILISNDFHLWRRAKFAACRIIGPSRYGENVCSSNLGEKLCVR